MLSGFGITFWCVPTPLPDGLCSLIVDLFDLAENLPQDQRLLGLDLGTKTIGLALSDVMLTIATPLETIKRTKFTADAEQLLAIVGRHQVGGLVLGYPLNMDGSK